MLAVWKSWWALAAVFGVSVVVLGIHDLRHPDQVWAKRRKQLPEEWSKRHGSKWVIQEGWAGVLSGLIVFVASTYRFLTD